MVALADKAKPIKSLPKENLMIVDAMNLAFRWKHQGQTRFIHDYIRTVKSLAASYDCGTIVIAADQGGSTFRKEVFPEYKANRKELYANDTEEQKELTRKFFDEFERVMEECDKEFILLRYKGVEADDIAGYLVKHRTFFGFNEIWLISSDRDWDLLIGPNVSRFSTVTRKEQTMDTWDYDVSPENYLTYKCLMGDSGDNVPGVTKVGPKTACKLIDQYGDIFDIADATPLAGKYVYIQNLNNFGADSLLRNVELMDIMTYCEEAIGSHNVLNIAQKMTGVPISPSAGE